MKDEETIIGNYKQTVYNKGTENPTNMQERPTKDKPSMGKDWQRITVGGVSGILLGAGAMFAANANATENATEQESNVDTSAEQQQGSVPQVATVNDSMSFSEAFASAREQVGPGGVFQWHGGIYGTYYANEWNAMSEEEHAAFAQSVQPEVHVQDINTGVITAEHPDIVLTETSQQPDSSTVEVVEAVEPTAQGDMATVDITDTPDNPQWHVVDHGIVDGHEAVALDITGNNIADLAIIDIDDNHQLSDPDIAINLATGDAVTLGEINEEPSTPTDMGPTAMVANNPGDGMSDYVNDAVVDV